MFARSGESSCVRSMMVPEVGGSKEGSGALVTGGEGTGEGGVVRTNGAGAAE